MRATTLRSENIALAARSLMERVTESNPHCQLGKLSGSGFRIG
jgi:hypothetical protein